MECLLTSQYQLQSGRIVDLCVEVRYQCQEPSTHGGSDKCTVHVFNLAEEEKKSGFGCIYPTNMTNLSEWRCCPSTSTRSGASPSSASRHHIPSAPLRPLGPSLVGCVAAAAHPQRWDWTARGTVLSTAARRAGTAKTLSRRGLFSVCRRKRRRTRRRDQTATATRRSGVRARLIKMVSTSGGGAVLGSHKAAMSAAHDTAHTCGRRPQSSASSRRCTATRASCSCGVTHASCADVPGGCAGTSTWQPAAAGHAREQCAAPRAAWECAGLVPAGIKYCQAHIPKMWTRWPALGPAAAGSRSPWGHQTATMCSEAAANCPNCG